jgi:hypothetical protein
MATVPANKLIALIRAYHQGQRSCEPQQQAEHKTAPDHHAKPANQPLQCGSHPHRTFGLAASVPLFFRSALVIRHLMRVTGTRISFWRCPVRGLAIEYRELPRTNMAHDHGISWKVLHFTQVEGITEAKLVLVIDMLLQGIGLYRALPNRVFDQDLQLISWLLTAPPSVSAEDWNKQLARLDRRFRDVLRTHEADLRFHLLGQKYEGPTGPVAITVRTRLETAGG